MRVLIGSPPSSVVRVPQCSGLSRPQGLEPNISPASRWASWGSMPNLRKVPNVPLRVKRAPGAHARQVARSHTSSPEDTGREAETEDEAEEDVDNCASDAG